MITNVGMETSIDGIFCKTQSFRKVPCLCSIIVKKKGKDATIIVRRMVPTMVFVLKFLLLHAFLLAFAVA